MEVCAQFCPLFSDPFSLFSYCHPLQFCPHCYQRDLDAKFFSEGKLVGWWHTRRASADLSIFLPRSNPRLEGKGEARKLTLPRDREPSSSSSRAIHNAGSCAVFPWKIFQSPPFTIVCAANYTSLNGNSLFELVVFIGECNSSRDQPDIDYVRTYSVNSTSGIVIAS